MCTSDDTLVSSVRCPLWSDSAVSPSLGVTAYDYAFPALLCVFAPKLQVRDGGRVHVAERGRGRCHRRPLGVGGRVERSSPQGACKYCMYPVAPI
eukprot:4810455-Pleurochrysis_carterae.AAC.1